MFRWPNGTKLCWNFRKWTRSFCLRRRNPLAAHAGATRASPIVDNDVRLQNVSFWSTAEDAYVCYFRVFKRFPSGGVRWVARTTSKDFLSWTPPVEMSFGAAPPEHLYTNQTSPYFRAPHIYVGIAARFMPGRQVLTPAEAEAIHVDPKYFQDCSDAVLLITRGGGS